MEHPMAATEYPLTRADFDRCRWQEVITGAQKSECFSYCMECHKKLRAAIEAKDEAAKAVFTVLLVVTDVDLRPDNASEPFGARFATSIARSTETGDLTDAQFAILQELALTVADPEMRARLCDLVWTAKRGSHLLAREAVRAYLESATVLEDPESWTHCEARMRRAVRLGRSLGAASAEHLSAVAHVEAVLMRLNGEDPSFLSNRLMELLQAVRKGDPAQYIPLAEKAARRAESEGGDGFRRARHYWECAAEWYRLAGDEAGRRTALVAAAETHVKQAEAAAVLPRERSPHLSAAGHLQRAIHALRKIGGESAVERARVLYRRMVEHQTKSTAEMVSVEHTVDFTTFVEFADTAVGGRPLDEALQRTAWLVNPAPVGELRAQVERMFAASPINALFATTTLGPTGKIVAQRPQFESTGDAREAATVAEMHRHATRHRLFVAQGYLVSAIQKIRSEHQVRLEDFYAITLSSSFVPPGRELTVARGLLAGFQGDLIVSTHLLIPQIEESIRVHLGAIGAITSGFNRQNLQNEFDLNTTLYLPELEQLYDPDSIFDLRGLLVEHHGSNLRNMMAHGLLNDQQLQTDAALYLWGLTLRLCVMMLPRESDPASTEDVTPPDDPASAHSAQEER
jgi:hypothetical protein